MYEAQHFKFAFKFAFFIFEKKIKKILFWNMYVKTLILRTNPYQNLIKTYQNLFFQHIK